MRTGYVFFETLVNSLAHLCYYQSPIHCLPVISMVLMLQSTDADIYTNIYPGADAQNNTVFTCSRSDTTSAYVLTTNSLLPMSSSSMIPSVEPAGLQLPVIIGICLGATFVVILLIVFIILLAVSTPVYLMCTLHLLTIFTLVTVQTKFSNFNLYAYGSRLECVSVYSVCICVCLYVCNSDFWKTTRNQAPVSAAQAQHTTSQYT